jgi:hypothetical protein
MRTANTSGRAKNARTALRLALEEVPPMFRLKSGELVGISSLRVLSKRLDLPYRLKHTGIIAIYMPRYPARIAEGRAPGLPAQARRPARDLAAAQGPLSLARRPVTPAAAPVPPPPQERAAAGLSAARFTAALLRGPRSRPFSGHMPTNCAIAPNPRRLRLGHAWAGGSRMSQSSNRL